jgi:hypothetical protein
VCKAVAVTLLSWPTFGVLSSVFFFGILPWHSSSSSPELFDVVMCSILLLSLL